MKTVFADTAFYVAVVSAHDALSPKAQDYARRFRGKLLTTEYVLIEVGNFLSRSEDRALFPPLVRRVHGDPNTTIIWASHSLFEQGLDLYAQRMDKEWSLTDCISFVVMKQHGITDALTGDHHFEQAGFRILLK